ncbi:MAG: hypothetical protein M3Y50_11670 [Acidobacteriota bacterium]|nr:hypothetical protein [Acidobacteriota bacterium]
MHEQHPGHIPPPDLPQHRTVLGFRPHIFLGGLILIAILVIYLLTFMNGAPRVSHAPTAPASTAPANSR